jgi:hypothetical protein
MRSSGRENDYEPYSGSREPARWSEWRTSDAYGIYKRTLKIKKGGSGADKGVWGAEIPEKGRYEIFVYIGVNEDSFRGTRRARPRLARIYKYLIRHAGGEEEIDFDVSAAEHGWNSLGTYRFKTGAAEVVLSDEGEGLIIFDAVRFMPVS